MNLDRTPCWPRGIVGSIAHNSDTCVAVVGEKNSWSSIGIDIETNTGIEEQFWDVICNPEELRFIRDQHPSEQPLFAKKLFVAKEAFYKWYFAQIRTILDFQSVSIQWRSNTSEFNASIVGSVNTQPNNQCNGKMLSCEGNVIAYCVTPVVHRQVVSSVIF